nr:hypothetical protein [Prevotella denticola]
MFTQITFVLEGFIFMMSWGLNIFPSNVAALFSNHSCAAFSSSSANSSLGIKKPMRCAVAVENPKNNDNMVIEISFFILFILLHPYKG